MTQRNQHHADEMADAVAETAKSAPRSMSAARAQQSWEEFKQRSNKMADAVMREVTQTALRHRASQAGRKARSFYRSYQTYILVGAAVAAVAGITVALLPTLRKKNILPKI